MDEFLNVSSIIIHHISWQQVSEFFSREGRFYNLFLAIGTFIGIYLLHGEYLIIGFNIELTVCAFSL